MAPRRRKRILQEDVVQDSRLPAPTEPAGLPELAWGIWLIVVALAITLFSGLWWATAWPEPKGLAIIRLQLGFAVPLALAWIGGLLAIGIGLTGLVSRKLGSFRPPVSERPTARRTLRRAY